MTVEFYLCIPDCRCPPSKDISLIIELQVSESTTQNLRTQAWLKVDLFNAKNTLLSGAWKVSFHLPPIRPDLPMSAMTSLPLYSDATLHLRVVNYKDSHSQSDSVISSANRVDYKFPLVMSTGETIPFSWDTWHIPLICYISVSPLSSNQQLLVTKYLLAAI